MSKSLGNSVDPSALADHYGTAALRYYLLTDINTGRDADFSNHRLQQRNNAELPNSLANLLNRSLSMAKRYRESRLRRMDSPLAALAGEKTSAYDTAMNTYQVQTALEHVMDFVTRCNAYVEETAPWKLAKDPSQSDKLDEVLYTLAESLRIVSILMSPILPKESAAIRSQLQWTGPATMGNTAWGLLPDGHELGNPVPLFPRIEAPAE
jgi:methionyl-tRNA synthetase